MNVKSFFAALSILGMGFLSYSQSSDYSEEVILGVFAHPDDEIYASPVLAKYASLGANVYLVIVTDGRYGTGQTDLQPGRELVEMRKGELHCSCENLGINKPIMLGYHDQLKLQDGFFGHVPYAQKLLGDLDSVINMLSPDVVITWGPDGGSNHMDHRIVGASVTQVYLNKDRSNSMKLYYVGTPGRKLEGEHKLLRGVDSKYLNARISYGREEALKTGSAIKCYKSQFSTERIQNRVEAILQGEKVAYFREFSYSPVVIEDFFE